MGIMGPEAKVIRVVSVCYRFVDDDVCCGTGTVCHDLLRGRCD